MDSSSNYIASSFGKFKESHKDYLETFNVVCSSALTEVHFTFWLYDLLDQDLDFSEDYYQRIQDTFRDWIVKHACVVAVDCNTVVSLIEYKQVFRNVSEFLSKQTFEPNNDKIKHTTERFLQTS
jgi:hypothetical protein